MGSSQCQVERGIGEKKLNRVGTSFIYPPTACHAQFVCVEPGAGSFPLLAPAHLSSFSPQTLAPPCLQTPQLRAQAQSPLCHLHSEEPASHLSPSFPMEVTAPGAAPPTSGTLSAWSAQHYVRKAPHAPHRPTMPSRGVQFYIQFLSTDF